MKKVLNLARVLSVLLLMMFAGSAYGQTPNVTFFHDTNRPSIINTSNDIYFLVHVNIPGYAVPLLTKSNFELKFVSVPTSATGLLNSPLISHAVVDKEDGIYEVGAVIAGRYKWKSGTYIVWYRFSYVGGEDSGFCSFVM